jgi:hypothetical protein
MSGSRLPFLKQQQRWLQQRADLAAAGGVCLSWRN